MIPCQGQFLTSPTCGVRAITRNRSNFFHYCTDGLYLATFLGFKFSTNIADCEILGIPAQTESPGYSTWASVSFPSILNLEEFMRSHFLVNAILAWLVPSINILFPSSLICHLHPETTHPLPPTSASCLKPFLSNSPVIH
jgi:hypothetical protein